MLRPERMSKVSVTGAKSVMPTTIEAIHELNLVHLSDYGGSWEYFEKGNPIEGAEAASQKLVTIRSLENTLGLEDDEFATRSIDEDTLDEQIEEVRTSVNDLDDRRSELREDRRDIQDRIDRLEPFAALGIDLDLLTGYDSIDVAVGHGPAAEIEQALAASAAVRGYELFHEDGAVGLFVAPADDVDDPIGDALVGVDFSRVEIPDGEGDPEQTITELEREKQKVDSELESVESELETLKHEHGNFLLSAERHLTTQVDRAEAPLQFATSDRAFIAEGWIPTERYEEFVDELRAAVGERLEIEELERAQFDRHGQAAEHEEVEPEQREQAEDSQLSESEEDDSVVTDEESEEAVVADGGVVTMGDEDPPVKQDNPNGTKSFELLTKAVGSPNYTEFDPTIVLFLTFPLMFGFIIGDIGYGAIYTAIGAYLYTQYDSETFKRVGVITLAAGGSTVLFGALYGELFGLHLDAFGLYDPILKKGLSPAETSWALTWFVVATLFGVLHLLLGYVFEFYEEFQLHGLKPAITEAGSWILAISGLWLFVFSDFLRGGKPEFLFQVFNNGIEGKSTPFSVGFESFPEIVGIAGVAMIAIAIVLLLFTAWYELVEIHVILGHPLSYLRISAVLLAKAGMAFVVNLLYFGAYKDKNGEFHFMIEHGREYAIEEYGQSAILFDGMANGGLALTIAGILVLIAGHIVVLLLGITSAGIQSIRLEYFEFFDKFYEGNGTTYTPFGQNQAE